jgi:hypothetical protein
LNRLQAPSCAPSWGHDGIAIDTYETERSVEKDIMTSTVELTGLMTQVRQSAQGLRSGDLLELTLCGAELTARGPHRHP